MNELSYRPMTADDYKAVRELWDCTAGMGLNPVDDSREGIDKFLIRNPGMSFVAEVRGKAGIRGQIAGALLCGHDGRRGSIYHLAVREDLRGRGIGRTLVARALKALRNEGIRKVSVVVFRTNEGGDAFWEKIGFEKRGDLVYRNTYTGVK